MPVETTPFAAWFPPSMNSFGDVACIQRLGHALLCRVICLKGRTLPVLHHAQAEGQT